MNTSQWRMNVTRKNGRELLHPGHKGFAGGTSVGSRRRGGKGGGGTGILGQ